LVTFNSLFRANNPGLITRAKKIDTFWMVEAPQGKFQDPIIWSSKIPAGTSTQAALQQLFGLGLFFVLFLINSVATLPREQHHIDANKEHCVNKQKAHTRLTAAAYAAEYYKQNALNRGKDTTV
jgi:hypothetical protein